MNKVAIVTGGSRGIGANIVKNLADNNYDVVFTYLNSEKESFEIDTNYANAYCFKADVSKEEDIKNLVSFTLNKFKKCDLLINNAGIDLLKTISDTTTEDFEKVLKTNLYSAFWLSKEISKIMVNQKSGHIINISSIWGSIGASCETAYSISKAGMDGLTKSLAKELGPSNIRVNSISPGIINTKMNSFLSEEDRKEIIDEIPLGRIGEAKDIADAVLMLDKCTYITGQIIGVNGGWHV